MTLNVYYHAVPLENGPAAAAGSEIDPEEITEVRWFAPDELPAEPGLGFPGHAAAVLAAWRAAARDGALESSLPDRPERPVMGRSDRAPLS